MVEAAMHHGFEMINDEGTVFQATQEQIVALMSSTVSQGAKDQTITMSSLGLSERPSDLNQWIDKQIGKAINEFDHLGPDYGVSADDASEIARGAVLHLIADKATLITNLANWVHAQNVKRGWWTDLDTGEDLHGKRNVGELLMLCVTEIAEAMEGYRKDLPDDKLPQYPMFKVELVDCIIRLLDILGSERNDVYPAGRIFVEKDAYNASRADHKPENRRKANGKKC